MFGTYKSLSHGECELEAADLHRHIRALRVGVLIEPVIRRVAGNVDDQRRRHFKLSVLGRRALAAEAARLRALVS
jgi:hypothetical protein